MYAMRKKEEFKERIEWIRAQQGRATVKQISEHFGITYSLAFQICFKNSLPYKKNNGEIVNENDRSGEEGFFNARKMKFI